MDQIDLKLTPSNKEIVVSC